MMKKFASEAETMQMEQAAIFRDVNIDFPQRATTIRSDFNISAKLKKLPLVRSKSRFHRAPKSQLMTEEVKLVVGSNSDEVEISEGQILPPNLNLNTEQEDPFIVPFEEELKIQEKKFSYEDVEDYTDDQFNKALDTEEESEEAKTMSEDEFENALNSEHELESLVVNPPTLFLSDSEEDKEECDPHLLHKREMEKQDHESLRRVVNPLLSAQRVEDIDDAVDLEIRQDIFKKKKTTTTITTVTTNNDSDDMNIVINTPSKQKNTRKYTQKSNSRYAVRTSLSQRELIPIEISSGSREGSQNWGSDSMKDDDSNEYYMPEKEDKEKLNRLKQRLLSKSQDSQNYSPSSSQNYSPSSSQLYSPASSHLSFGSESQSQNRDTVAKMLSRSPSTKRLQSPKLASHQSNLVQSFSSQNKGLCELSQSKPKTSLSASSLFFRTEGSQSGSQLSEQKTPTKNTSYNSKPSTPQPPSLRALQSAGLIVHDTTPNKGKQRNQGKK